MVFQLVRSKPNKIMKKHQWLFLKNRVQTKLFNATISISFLRKRMLIIQCQISSNINPYLSIQLHSIQPLNQYTHSQSKGQTSRSRSLQPVLRPVPRSRLGVLSDLLVSVSRQSLVLPVEATCPPLFRPPVYRPPHRSVETSRSFSGRSTQNKHLALSKVGNPIFVRDEDQIFVKVGNPIYVKVGNPIYVKVLL